MVLLRAQHHLQEGEHCLLAHCHLPPSQQPVDLLHPRAILPPRVISASARRSQREDKAWRQKSLKEKCLCVHTRLQERGRALTWCDRLLGKERKTKIKNKKSVSKRRPVYENDVESKSVSKRRPVYENAVTSKVDRGYADADSLWTSSKRKKKPINIFGSSSTWDSTRGVARSLHEKEPKQDIYMFISMCSCFCRI